MRRQALILGILLCTCRMLCADSTTTVTTQFILGNHDTLSSAEVIFELYGVSSAIDTNASKPVLMRAIRTETDDSGYVSVDLLRNEYLMSRKYGAVHPWWQVTVRHSTLTTPLILYGFIDADSTGTFSFGTWSDAIQFSAP